MQATIKESPTTLAKAKEIINKHYVPNIRARIIDDYVIFDNRIVYQSKNAELVKKAVVKLNAYLAELDTKFARFIQQKHIIEMFKETL